MPHNNNPYALAGFRQQTNKSGSGSGSRASSTASVPVPTSGTPANKGRVGIPSRPTSPTAHPRGSLLAPPPAITALLPGPDTPLNPDLPTSDVLFVFVNFASYAKAPGQGGEGVTEEDLKHATRLLDYARDLQASPKSRVSILHLKYRTISDAEDLDTRKHTPPFSTLLDPVIKINYKSTGSFDPAPGASIFDHIAKHVQPPPRFLVYSYVGSIITNQQLGILATWCADAEPPIALLSPTETRLREDLPLDLALRESIDISMYASEELIVNNQLRRSSDSHGPRIGSLSMGTPSGRVAFWRLSRSVSGGSYLKGKEEALRGLGVALLSQSHGSMGRGSWSSDTGTLPGGRRYGRNMRMEDVIDSLEMGDVPADGEQALPSTERRESIQRGASSSSGGSQLAKTPPAPSQIFLNRNGNGKSNSRSQSKQPGSVSWRDLVISHMDSTDPEFVQTYLD